MLTEEYGNWIIREIAAPDGYGLSDTQYPVTIAEEGTRGREEYAVGLRAIWSRSSNDAIVTVVLSQIGNVGGQPYFLVWF